MNEVIENIGHIAFLEETIKVRLF
jgi:hypothetical protein